MIRSLRLLALAVLAVVATVASPLPAAAQETDEGNPAPAPEETSSEDADADASSSTEARPSERPVIERRQNGQRAIDALGDRFPDVARRNGRSPDELRDSLLEDETLWVSRSGQLLFIDPAPEPAPTDDTAAAAAAVSDEALGIQPLSQTFELHSDPGANRVIYLDFDGHDAGGTAWVGENSNVDAQPYDTDGDPAAFSNAERRDIQDIWLRVAEDFAPFGVDVTTRDPGAAAIRRSSGGDQQYGTRVAITTTNVIGCGCGGVAYVGVFNLTGADHDRYQPAWVFSDMLGRDAKNIAEAASHEAGHNLNLDHDRTPTQGYYDGHGDWAPIMGVGYSRPITQWSRGEYGLATQTQDDLAVMAAHGIPLRADEHGVGSSATEVTDLNFDHTGIIGTRTDIDGFRFDTNGGPFTVRVDVASTSPNLDVHLQLQQVDGTPVASDDVSSGPSQRRDLSLGLGAEIDVPALTAGSYEVTVEGVGMGDPTTDGYSDYASLGRYHIVGMLPGGLAQNRTPRADAVATTTLGSNQLTLDGTGSNDPDDDPLTYTWHVGGSPVATGATPTWTAPDYGTHEITLTVHDGEVVGSAELIVTTERAPSPSAPTDVTVQTTPDNGALVTWTDTADNENALRIVRKRRLDTGNFGEWTKVADLAPDTETWNDHGTTPGNEYRYQVSAVNQYGKGKSAFSASYFAPAPASTRPSAPKDVTVQTTPDDGALVTWTDTADNENALRIVRKRRLDTGNFGEWTMVADLAPDTETWNDHGTTPGNEYRYQVKAVNQYGQGRSAYSASYIAP